MSLAAQLNRDCQCLQVDPAVIGASLDKAAPPHMFSQVPVFVSEADLAAMREAVAVLERSLRSGAFMEAALADAPEIARINPRTPGVLYGFDFHLDVQGPRLIEINTNAGGAMLSSLLGRSGTACCDESDPPIEQAADHVETFVEMFRREWQLFGAGRPLRRIAIVDTAPTEQYLYPELVLFRDAFRAAGIEAWITDPKDLDLATVDLVYNRLTDFYFEAHAELREAYASGRVLVTPHPRGHALFASKRNLVRLCDERLLATLPEADRALVRRVVPHAERVLPGEGERLWRERKNLFFKPAHGYGSKAAYRGDKLTKSTFAAILAGDYIAQAYVPPSERIVTIDGEPRALKLDLRAYAYEGRVQLFAARLYAGQTTNFRTEGGGFAQVLSA